MISPWREWDLNSRSKLIEYAEANGIEVPSHKRGEPPFSMDANLLHISYEGCALGWWLTCDNPLLTADTATRYTCVGACLLLNFKCESTFCLSQFRPLLHCLHAGIDAVNKQKQLICFSVVNGFP